MCILLPGQRFSYQRDRRRCHANRKKWAEQDKEIAQVRSRHSCEGSLVRQHHFMEMLGVCERQDEEFKTLLRKFQENISEFENFAQRKMKLPYTNS
jgi:catalase (peroxidase I)